jgi:hypothetical protein
MTSEIFADTPPDLGNYSSRSNGFVKAEGPRTLETDATNTNIVNT